MELLLSPSSFAASIRTTASPRLNSSHRPFPSPLAVAFPNSIKQEALSGLRFSSISSCNTSIKATPPSSAFSSDPTQSIVQRHWMVLVEPPPGGAAAKAEFVNYYVGILGSVLGSEMDAQMCIYDVSCGPQHGFYCEIDEETSRLLGGLPGVLSVRPVHDLGSSDKDYSLTLSTANGWNLPNAIGSSIKLFPNGNTKHWLVRIAKPTVRIVTKAQMVDHFVQLLTKVMRNETDAQMCIYHISWQYDFGFCCELDEQCAKELIGVPGVLSVQPDDSFESQTKNYKGDDLSNSLGSSTDNRENIKTKKLFVTGLSFYTSEKTLRAAFEGFGELVEVKIIMDKISKRSKGYAFLEYTTEEAAGAALREMNGKIINGWMIVVDVAKKSPPKYSRGSPVS
ncbi:unnamed protein product [Rhodiola kirilowii]